MLRVYVRFKVMNVYGEFYLVCVSKAGRMRNDKRAFMRTDGLWACERTLGSLGLPWVTRIRPMMPRGLIGAGLMSGLVMSAIGVSYV